MIELAEKISAWDSFYDQNHTVLATKKKDFLVDEDIFDEDGNFLEDIAIKKYATPLPELSMDTLEEEFSRMRRKLHESRVIIEEHLGKAPLGFDSVSGLIERGEELIAKQQQVAKMHCNLFDSSEYRRIAKKNKDLAAELRELKKKGVPDEDSSMKIENLEIQLMKAKKIIKKYKENPFSDLTEDEIHRIMRRAGTTEKLEKKTEKIMSDMKELEHKYDSDIAERDKKIEEIGAGKDELTEENTGLKLEKDNLQEQIKKLEERDDKMDANLREAAQQLTDKKEYISKLEEKNSELDAKAKELEVKVKDQEQKFDERIEAEIEKITGSEKELAAEITALKKDVEDFRSAKETAEAQVRRLTEDYDSAVNDKEAAEDEAASLKEQRDGFKVRIDELEENAVKKKEEYDNIIDAKQQETEGLEQELKTAKKAASVDVDKIKADAEAAAEEKYKDYVSPADVKNKIEDAKKDAEAAVDKKYKGRIADLEKAAEEAKKSAVSDEDIQKQVDAAKEAGKQEAEQKYKQDIENTGKLTKSLQEGKKALEKRLEEEEQKREELIKAEVEERLKSLDKDDKELSKELMQVKGELEAERISSKTAKNRYKSEIKDAEEEIQELKNDLDEARKGTVDEGKVRAEIEAKVKGEYESKVEDAKKDAEAAADKKYEGRIKGLEKKLAESKKGAPVDEGKVRAEIEKKYDGFVSPADAKKKVEDAKKDAEAAADKKYKDRIAGLEKDVETAKKGVDPEALKKEVDAVVKKEKEALEKQYASEKEVLQKKIDEQAEEIEELKEESSIEKGGEIDDLKKEIKSLEENIAKHDKQMQDKDKVHARDIKLKDAEIKKYKGQAESRKESLDRLKDLHQRYNAKVDKIHELFDALDVLAVAVDYNIPSSKPALKAKGLLAKIPVARRWSKNYQEAKKIQDEAKSQRNINDYVKFLDYLARHPGDVPAKSKRGGPVPVKIPEPVKEPEKEIVYIEKPSEDVEKELHDVLSAFSSSSGMDGFEDARERFYEVYLNRSNGSNKRYRAFVLADLAYFKQQKGYFVDAIDMVREAYALTRESYEETRSLADKKQMDLLEHNLRFLNKNKDPVLR